MNPVMARDLKLTSLNTGFSGSRYVFKYSLPFGAIEIGPETLNPPTEDHRMRRHTT